MVSILKLKYISITMCYVCLSVEGRRCSGEVRSMILRGGGNGKTWEMIQQQSRPCPFKVPRVYLGPGMNLLQPRTRICGPVSALTSQTPRLSRRFDIVSGFVQKREIKLLQQVKGEVWNQTYNFGIFWEPMCLSCLDVRQDCFGMVVVLSHFGLYHFELN